MADVVLITMPWDLLEAPSLALGTLQALLREDGLDVESCSLKLRWMDFMLEHQRPDTPRITLFDYHDVAHRDAALGDWIFAEAPMSRPARLSSYEDLLRGQTDPERFARWLEMRRLAPAFLDRCVDEVLALGGKVVGFSTTFSQNMASLALARRLKRAEPSLRVVFGGANCEGPMGAALQRRFPWIDVVVRGEGEPVAPDLFRALLAGAPPPRAPGLCFFEDGAQVVVPNRAVAQANMDALPMPDFDEYFAKLEASSYHDTLLATLFVPMESARGCWWGELAHCTFCGLNGASMKFRSKSPGRVLEEIQTLVRRYRVLDLHFTDNILDHAYFGDLLPAIARIGLDLELFYEVKSNLRKAQLELLHRAGVRRLQPGIESLSTPILGLMRKGVTAWQNVRLLKWCAQLGIEPVWNLLYGFPGEPEEEYARMADLIPSLVHLWPPGVSPISVHRFSPYHARPEEHGIEITGPAWHYPLLYDADPETLAELAYEFAFRHLDGRSPRAYAAGCIEAAERWRRLASQGASLTYRRGAGFIQVRDRRAGDGAAHFVDHTLEDAEAEVYLACDDGARFGAICRRTGLTGAVVQGILDELACARLVLREGDHYLGLAIARTPPAAVTAEEREPAGAGGELVSVNRLREARRAG